VNTHNIPEDCQAWSYLALQSSRYASSLDWARANLATADNPWKIQSKLPPGVCIQGQTYATCSLSALARSSPRDELPDPAAVWLEGTAHTSAGLAARGRSSCGEPPCFLGDADEARLLLKNICLAQQKLGSGQTVKGRALGAGGVVAASSVLNTGFGFSYYPAFHIGATSWYLIAGKLANPFVLGYGR
jgi:hypothetical protein